MHKLKNIWFFVVGALSVLMVAVAVYFVVQHMQEVQPTFSQDGYVLHETVDDQHMGDGSKTQPVYFKSGDTYTSKYPRSIVFSDVQNNQIAVDEASFLHYADGSITALSAGVVLNLGDMEDETMIRCYGLKAGTVVQKSGSVYLLDHMGTPITYSRFIWKLGAEKYLIAADSFELQIPNQQSVQISDYIEVEYVDNSIITIYNNDVILRTIASDCDLVFDDDVVINLSDQAVLSGDEVMMSFAQMVINSDENINVTPLEKTDQNAVIPKFVTIDGIDGENGQSGDGGKAGEGGEAGALGDSVGTGEDIQEPTETEESVILPVFEVEIDQSSLTASSVRGSVRITDSDSRLVPGSVAMQIMDNITGDIVFGPEYYDGFAFDFEATGLTQDAAYRLIFEAEYTVGDEQYSKIFYDGVFMADAIGLSFDIDDVKTDELAFKVKKEAFSPVTSAMVELYDENGNLLDQMPVSFTSNSEVVTFNSGLTPNMSYIAQLAQVGGSYENGTPVQYDIYGEPIVCKTLKRTPTVGQPNVTVNKRSGTFEIQVSGLTDPDNGVQEIRYEIYETSGTSPVSTAYGNGTDRVDFEVNGYIQRNTYYTVKAIAEFNDNLKTVDVESNMSAAFIMEGADFPTLRFEAGEIEFDRIEGTLYIESTGATVDTAKTITVHWEDSVGNVYDKTVAATVISGNRVTIDFNEGGLRQKETYSVWVTASVDMNDSNPVDEVMIGPVKVQTIEANAFLVSMSKTSTESADPSKAISIDVTLGDVSDIDASYEASTLESLVFNLYEGSTKDSSKLLSSLPINDSGGESYASALKSQFYDGTQTLTEDDFGLNSASLTSSTYLVELESAHDYTDHDSNYFTLQNNTFAFIKTSTPPLDPSEDQRSDSFDITPITLNNIGAYKVELSDWLSAATIEALDDDTILGYEVSPKFNNSGKYARRVTYQMYKLADYQDSPLIDNATAVGTVTTIAPDGIDVPVEASQDYLPNLVVLFGSQGSAQTGFAGSDKTRYYYFTGYEQENSTGGFGRGAQYFFSYTAKLNTLDSTASYNTDYPSDPSDPSMLLYSTVVSPVLQAPAFAFYPSATNNSSVTWKYQYVDIDNVLQKPTATLYCRETDGTAIDSTTVSKTSGSFGTASFGGFSSSISAYELYVRQNLLSAYAYGTTGEVRSILSRSFETDSFTTLSYSVFVPSDNMNRLFIVLGEDAAHMGNLDDDVLKRIAGAEVTATSVSDPTKSTVMNLGVERANVNGSSQVCIEVPYSLLEDFEDSESIAFTVNVYYDTGQSGFDINSNYYAIQFPVGGAIPAEGNYRVIRSIGTGYMDGTSASGSWFHTVSHSAADKTITFGGNMMANDTTAGGAFSLTYRENGAYATISGAQRLITLKVLKAIVPAAEGSVTITKPTAVSEVTIDLVNDVSVGLDSISGQFKVTGLDVIEGTDFYIEFYDGTMSLLNSLTLTIPVSSGSSDVYSFSRSGGLSADTNYYFRIAGYIGGNLVTFYDTDAQEPKYYPFKTLGEVHVQNVEMTYEPASYLDKTLYANFTLDTTMGFNLAYDFVRLSDGDVLTDEELAGIIGVLGNTRSMKVPIDIDPTTVGGNWFKFGESYKVYITAYSGTKPTYDERYNFSAGSTETQLLGQNVTDFDLNTLSEPIMGLSATASDDGGVQKLSVRVAPGDWDRTIVNDNYYLRIFDSAGSDVTPTAETAAKLATASPYTVEVSGLEVGSEYTIRCYGVVDLENSGLISDITGVINPTSSQHIISEIKAYTLDSSGISVGTVTPRQSPTNSRYVQLTFTNSVNLTEITELRYSIYKNGEAIEGLKKISFTNLKEDTVNQYYYLDLETVLPEAGSYMIQVQYYKDSLKIGADATYSYIYTE